MTPRRLDKHLHLSAPLCRRAIQAAIWAKRVQVWSPGDEGPQVVGEAHRLIFPDEDVVWLDGERLRPRRPSCYVMLHKPLGVVSVAREPHGKPCLDPWLDALPPGAFAVGRLDRDTSGLLLMTDDGELGFALMSPRHHVPRTYTATVSDKLTSEDPRLAALARPIHLRDGVAHAVAVSLQSADLGASRVLITVGEGRKRQVRRMVAAVNLDLVALERVRLGPLDLGALPAGEARALTAWELGALWEAVGGQDAPRRGALAALRALAEDHRAHGDPDARLEAWLERA
jgi:23S rRNA pseudouridine2605 synthase